MILQRASSIHSGKTESVEHAADGRGACRSVVSSAHHFFARTHTQGTESIALRLPHGKCQGAATFCLLSDQLLQLQKPPQHNCRTLKALLQQGFFLFFSLFFRC